MKYLFTMLLLFTIILPGIAQIEADSKFINGTVRLSVTGSGGNARSAVTFTPTFGYFISDELAVGGTLGIVSQPSGIDNDLTIYLSPFARRYFSIVDDTFYFYANGELSLSYGNSAAGFGNFRSDTDALSVSLTASPGFVYFPSERWGIDFTFTAFGLSLFGIDEEETILLFTLGLTTFSPSLGFSYYF